MEFRDIDDVDEFDLTSPVPARSAGGNDVFSSTPSALPLTSEGFGGGVSAWMQPGLVSPHRVFRK
jgi:hypothetical protein